MQPQKTIVVIAGPTAVGKTSAAIKLARYLNTEIISADSRQCFSQLNIGVARPSLEELSLVPHHFIASHSIFDTVNAAVFEDYALQKANELFEVQNVVVMVGGTGLYIKAFCEGLDGIPEVPEQIRNEVRNEYAEKGLAWLQAEVAEKDPQFSKGGEVQNPHRLLRALEVFRATNQSIETYKKGVKKDRPFSVVKIALHLPKEALQQNIAKRVDVMMEEGLEEEVFLLVGAKNLPPLQTVGYKEMFEYFDGKISKAKAVEYIKTHTRQYAKRQITWFKKDDGFRWFLPTENAAMLTYINQQLHAAK